MKSELEDARWVASAVTARRKDVPHAAVHRQQHNFAAEEYIPAFKNWA